jgi:hypothetical protein
MCFISKLLTLPQAWRNGLVGDSIPALITELCLLLIQLELSLLMIAAELITLLNLLRLKSQESGGHPVHYT